VYQWKKDTFAEPVKWLDIDGYEGFGKTLQVGRNKDCIIINEEKEQRVRILGVDLKGSITSKITIQEEIDIRNHKSCGKFKNEVVLALASGELKLYQYKLENDESELIASITENLEENEQFWLVSSCPRGETFAVLVLSTKDWPFTATKIILYQLKNLSKIEKKCEIDISQDGFLEFESMEFFGYENDNLILTAVAHKSQEVEKNKNYVLTYELDSISGNCYELFEMRKILESGIGYCKMSKIEDKLLCCNFDAEVLEIGYRFE